MLIGRPSILALVVMLVCVVPACTSHADNTGQADKVSQAAGQETKNGLVTDQVRAFIAPASGGNGAVFMDITNHAPETITITGATTPVSETAELHTHEHDDGVMKMRPVDSFSISGNGGTHRLRPGGDHIMLLNLTTPLKAGRQFPLTLEFADRKARAITVHVVRPGAKVPDTQ